MKELRISKADLNSKNEYAKSDSLEFEGYFGVAAHCTDLPSLRQVYPSA